MQPYTQGFFKDNEAQYRIGLNGPVMNVKVTASRFHKGKWQYQVKDLNNEPLILLGDAQASWILEDDLEG